MTLSFRNVILGKIKKKMKKINKKYFHLMELVDQANGRKEFISLLKKVTQIKTKNDDVKAA